METNAIEATYRINRLHSLDLQGELAKRLRESPEDLAWVLATTLADYDPAAEHHRFKVETIRRRMRDLIIDAAEEAQNIIANKAAEQYVTSQENGDFRQWQIRITFEQTEGIPL